MHYEFVTIQPSGNRKDELIVLQEIPGWFEKLRGKVPRRVAFYGHPHHWQKIDGSPVSDKLTALLDKHWSAHAPAGVSNMKRSGGGTQDVVPMEAARQSSDPVDEASEESFPASDPPSWTPMTGN